MTWIAIVEDRDSHTVHVIPNCDLIEHDDEGDDCACGPSTEFLNGGKVITHNSLDGREDDE